MFGCMDALSRFKMSLEVELDRVAGPLRAKDLESDCESRKKLSTGAFSLGRARDCTHIPNVATCMYVKPEAVAGEPRQTIAKAEVVLVGYRICATFPWTDGSSTAWMAAQMRKTAAFCAATNRQLTGGRVCIHAVPIAYHSQADPPLIELQYSIYVYPRSTAQIVFH